MNNGASIVISIDDSLTHSVLFVSSIMDYDIHMPYPSHFVHTSLLDGAKPSDFMDVFLAISSPLSVTSLTILDPMRFSNSSFVLGINPDQIILEYFEHLLPSPFHTSTTKVSLSVYGLEDYIFSSHDSTGMLICHLFDYLHVISNHGVFSFTLVDLITSPSSYMSTCGYPLSIKED